MVETTPWPISLRVQICSLQSRSSLATVSQISMEAAGIEPASVKHSSSASTRISATCGRYDGHYPSVHLRSTRTNEGRCIYVPPRLSASSSRDDGYAAIRIAGFAITLVVGLITGPTDQPRHATDESSFTSKPDRPLIVTETFFALPPPKGLHRDFRLVLKAHEAINLHVGLSAHIA
jgi:hypothetical protein